MPETDPQALPCVQDVTRRLEVRAATGEYPPSPFDVLIDQTLGSAREKAIREAQEMCGACPIQASCLVENRNEEWMQRLIGVRVRKKPTTRESCGRPLGYTHHLRAKEHPCPDCRAAHAAKIRRQDQVRKAKREQRRSA